MADEGEYATTSERFFATWFAPRIVTQKGRYSIIIIWSIVGLISLYGLTKLRTDFNQDLFIPEGSPTDQYY